MSRVFPGFYFLLNYREKMLIYQNILDISAFFAVHYLLFWCEVREGIGLCGNFQFRIFDVGIDLSGIEMLMAQNLLNCFHIDPLGKHQGCRCVPELMGRILGGI
jgi:hypothetical protein